MIRSSLYFTYNGVSSEKYNIVNVNIESSGGMQSEPFVAQRTILEQTRRGNDKPLFQEITRSPFEFDVSFAFQDTWDSSMMQSVVQWLTNPTFYCPLVFSDNQDLIYYCLVTNSPSIVHNSLSQGYISLHFRCDGAYAYSPVYKTEILDYSNNVTDGTSFRLNNLGDVSYSPIIIVKLISDGTFTITNSSNGSKYISFTGLTNNETLTIDCEDKTIKSDIALTYRYDKMTGDFLEIIKGKNLLNIKGNVTIQWKYQMKYSQQ